MKFDISSEDIFGFIKPVVDVHTMGVYTIANLLRDCGYKVIVAKDEINKAMLDTINIIAVPYNETNK